MKIVVCVKHAASVGDELEFVADGDAVDPDYLDHALNEWDAYATEEALRLREAHGGEVVIATIGDEDAETSVRRCLAMGADRGIRAWSDQPCDGDPIWVASALATVLGDEAPDLILCGVRSSDAMTGATGPALAALLGLPCVTVAIGLAYDEATQGLRVRRELEGGLVEVRELRTPAVVTVQTGINEPRYATFRAIKQADQKPLVARDVPADRPSGARMVGFSRPVRESQAEMLTGRTEEIAAQIATLVRERVR